MSGTPGEQAETAQPAAETSTRRGNGAGKSSRAEEEQLAREAWALLFEIIQEQMRHFPALAAEFELSPVQAHVLRMLGHSPLAMSALANQLFCDASNVTGLVDRLEARGLLERRAAEHDRRVKMLCLTEEGWELRHRLQERMAEPPVAISALSAPDLNALREVLQRALEVAETLKAEGHSAPVTTSARAEREAQSSKKV